MIQFFKKKILNIFKDKYIFSLISGIMGMLLFTYLSFIPWNIAAILTCSMVVIFLLYTNMSLKKIIISLLILIFLGSFCDHHIIDRTASNSVKFDEIIETNETYTLYFHDVSKSCILFVSGKESPLLFSCLSYETYLYLKTEYKAGNIKIKKRKLKYWYEKETTIGYFLEGFQFK